VREERAKPIEETLILQLAGQHMLLVLDNCEHLIDTCAALVGRLLASTAALCVLVTSREGLGIAGERVVQVRSLTLPPPGTDQNPDALAGFEAVRLFVERAQQVAPEFGLGAGNAPAVVEICRRLDGIPLALELAAARVALLSVEQIRAGLDDRFRLLTGSSRAVSRHQTLLATLQSSFESLVPDEQRHFRRLSVFAGGWTLGAATAVIGQADDLETVERLGRLVDKSLVLVDRTGPDGPRYGMLETVRQYSRDILIESGESEDARDAHLAHFLDFARTAQAGLFGDAVRQWLNRIDAELPNLLAAHAWCDRASDGANRGLELATNLRTYWLGRGLFASGQRVYEEALARRDSDPRSMLRGRALYALGQHCYVRGQLEKVPGPTEEALSIAREHGDDEWVVYCLDRLSLTFVWLGDTVRARECCEEELAVARRTGNQRLIGFALTAEGGVCRAQGNFDAAARAYEQALTLFEAGRDPHNRHNALVDVARVAIARGTLGRAREALAAAIRLVGELGTMYRGHFSLEATSRLAAACEEWLVAARLQGASDAAVDKMGGTRTWFDDPILASLHERPAALLGPEAYASAYDQGRGLALEVALGEAAAWLEKDALSKDRANGARGRLQAT
jgi:non-specific serine/threonine protein kinase